jgi:FkbM family methyltransferase
MHSLFVDIYWSIQSRLHDGSVTVQVGEREATFSVTTPSEYYRFQELLGEDLVINDVLSELTTDDVFYDIGANVGMFTCFIAQALPPEHVIAFEPHPTNAEQLEENLTLNELEATIHKIALADEESTAELAVDERDEAGAGRHALAVGGEDETITVDLVRGDTLIAEGTVLAPTVLKIDVEGAELDVLRGLQNTLIESCRLCYVEVHPDRIRKYDGTAKEVEEFLSELGFNIETIYEREDDEYFLKAERQL